MSTSKKKTWDIDDYEYEVIKASIISLNKYKSKITPDQAIDIHILSEELI